MSPIPPKRKLMFFQGDSDDLNALHDVIATWIDELRGIATDYHIYVNFDSDKQSWHILATIFYVDNQSQVVRAALTRTIPLSPN